ncbi:hypothetical protein DHEL01_v212923 [Diaporthe helianthi]|uniref:Uncharacterized protein n=1 Tax=Diaporthe helianthi TaxID=158607 RepID=A0A2P5HEK1_DIAHE|nr:hypothetical protein DHEL01_v212923 [Diaporthe helianthi]
MSNLGQNIKETLTCHHDQDKRDVKTPDVNAPGAYPSDDSATKHDSDHNKLTKEPPEHLLQANKAGEERGVQHHTGHAHHDPEPETKQATSDAGNYPYWGNLPREGGPHVHRSDGPSGDTTMQHNGLSNESTHAAGAIGADNIGANKSKDHETSKSDEATRADPTTESKLDDASKGAGVAGLAGATYLATRDKEDIDKTKNKQTHKDSDAPTHANKSKTVQEIETSTDTQKPVEAATPTKTTSTGDNDSHRKEVQVIAAGAGASGLAGAGYYASQRGDKKDEEKRDTTSSSHATKGSNTQTSSHTTPHHDPTTEAQKATSAAGNYPYWKDGDNEDKPKGTAVSAEAATPTKTTSSGDNDRHRKEMEVIAAGAGASGVAGAGFLASKNREDHEEDKQSSPTLGQATSKANEHHTHTSNQHETKNDTRRATSGALAENSPNQDNQEKEDRNNKELAAAGLGGAALAGTGYLASNGTDEREGELPGSTRETSSGIAAPGSFAERDTTSRPLESTSGGSIHDTGVGAAAGSSNSTSATHQTTTSSQASQPTAQAAAVQAWNNQQQRADSSSPGRDKSAEGESKHSDLKYAAAGTAFGAGAAGLAADYGQGKPHEQSPRTDQAEKVAERALGSDGKAQAPAATDGSRSSTDGKSASSGATSGVTGLAAHPASGSTGNGRRVFHKCEKCGHDNDISRYVDKDAVFHAQQ